MENTDTTAAIFGKVRGHYSRNGVGGGLESSSTPHIKVLIIGLGQLGLPVAKYVLERGFETYGYDISVEAMERAEKTVGIKRALDFGSEDFDVFIISISTHQPDDMFTPQIDGLLAIAHKISREATKDGAIVSIESTIPRGTSMKVFETLNHRLHVIHTPHRWYALEEKEHGVNQLRVMGGMRECCLKAGMQFYGGVDTVRVDGQICSSSSSLKSLGIPIHPVSNIEIAEITKIAENAYRYLQIALAEELYLSCQANNINFPKLRAAVNTKWNVDILEPREGIGGHCLPKDTKMFLQSSRYTSKILEAATEIDQEYRQYLRERVQLKYVTI